MKKLKKFLKSPLMTAVIPVVLEASRWAVLTVVAKLLLILPTLEQTFDVSTLLVLLRLIDASLHKSGVAEKGLTRF